MKHTIILLNLFLLSSIISSAQKIGIKAGGNFSNTIVGGNSGTSGSFTSADKHTFIPGYHAGIFGEYDLGKTISLQLEAVYSTKGFKQKYTMTSSWLTTVQTVTYTYSYLDVPFIVNIHFGETGSYIGLGPQ